MRKLLLFIGKTFQLMALVTLPSAIWVGHINHGERGAIGIFVVSVLIFFLGYLLIHFSSKL